MDKEAILGREDLRSVAVFVPEWQATVHVWTLTGEQREQFEDELDKYRDDKGKLKKPIYRALLVCFAVGEADGKRIFEPGDAAKLATKSARALTLLARTAEKLNALTEKEVELLEKNFGGGLGDGSPSSSPLS